MVWCYMVSITFLQKFSEIVLHFDFFICPVKEITMKPFTYPTCDTSELSGDYTFHYDLPLLGSFKIPMKVIHFHTLVLGLFASLLAPLGGLFASGFKRAIKIKDFASTIPGHGGITDRMDCQILMVSKFNEFQGFFTYLWTHQFLFFNEDKKINYIFNLIHTLHHEDQVRVFNYLNTTLYPIPS